MLKYVLKRAVVTIPTNENGGRYAHGVPAPGRLRAVECLALDVFAHIDVGGELITRRLVQARWDELAGHRDECQCGLCEMLPRATVTKVWRLAARWQSDVNQTRILARR